MERGQRSVERMHDVREQGKYKACVHMSMWHLRSLQQIDPRMGVPESTKVSNARAEPSERAAEMAGTLIAIGTCAEGRGGLKSAGASGCQVP